MSDADTQCCYIGTDRCCQKTAEYIIRDEADQDPAGSFTEACTEHVGALLGHRLGLADPRFDRWTVIPIRTPA